MFSSFPLFFSSQNLTKLTSINLSGCQYLTRISDFSGVPNLVRLDLGNCSNLTEVDPSVGFLNKLKELSLDDCYNLTVFPTTISLKSLRTFYLCGCEKFERFPEIVGKMERLYILELSGTAIKELPPSFENLTGLENLMLKGCQIIANLPQSIHSLPCLRHLDLSFCPNLVTLPPELPTNSNISLDNFASVAFPLQILLPSLRQVVLSFCPNLVTMLFDERNLSDIDTLANFGRSSILKEIFLCYSNFESLPACISKFVWLERLDLCGCKRLREILELPPNIRWINVCDCILLEIFPTLSEMILLDGDMRLIRCMDMSSCQRLCENLALDVSKMASVLLHQAGKCYEVISIILPGSEVPNWFSCRKDVRVVVDGTTTDPCCLCKIYIEIPRTFKWKNTGLVFCAAFKTTQNFSGKCCLYTETEVDGVYIDDPAVCLFESRETDAAHVWLQYIPLPAHMKSKVGKGKPYRCRISVYSDLEKGLLLNGCGVHLGKRKRKRMLAIKS